MAIELDSNFLLCFEMIFWAFLIVQFLYFRLLKSKTQIIFLLIERLTKIQSDAKRQRVRFDDYFHRNCGDLC